MSNGIAGFVGNTPLFTRHQLIYNIQEFHCPVYLCKSQKRMITFPFPLCGYTCAVYNTKKMFRTLSFRDAMM